MNEKRYWFVFCRVCECVRAMHAYTFSISTSLRGVAPSLSACLPACLRVCQRHAAPLGRQCPRSSDIGITSRFDLRRVFIVTCLLCLAPAVLYCACRGSVCLFLMSLLCLFLFFCCSVCGIVFYISYFYVWLLYLFGLRWFVACGYSYLGS